MKIDVLQVESEGENSFEIKYNDKLQYKARTPFISIDEPLNLERLRSIKIFDMNNNEIYTTNYEYVENFKEEFIPMEFLITGNQKFNQLLFTSEKNIIKIHYEEKAIWNNRYVIEINNKQYFCYSIQDGYIRHFPIYDGEIQIGEALKSNVIIDNKDEYCCYLKEGYENVSDGIVALLLYLDRSQYNSAYLINKYYNLSKKYSYNKTNKYYDKEWVSNNFGNEFYKKVDENIELVKEKFKDPLNVLKEQWSFAGNKKILKSFFTSLLVFIFMFFLIVLVKIIFSS